MLLGHNWDITSPTQPSVSLGQRTGSGSLHFWSLGGSKLLFSHCSCLKTSLEGLRKGIRKPFPVVKDGHCQVCEALKIRENIDTIVRWAWLPHV